MQDAAGKALKGHWVPVSRPGISPDSASFPSGTCFPRSGLEPAVSPRSLAPFVGQVWGLGAELWVLGVRVPLPLGCPFSSLSADPRRPHTGECPLSGHTLALMT